MNKMKEQPNLLNTNKKKATAYKQTLKPQNTYNSTNTLIKKISDDEKDPLKNTRGTIRLPLDQKCELDALLEMSLDYHYTYELLAELIYNSVSKMSKEQSEEYYTVLNRLKEKELKKIAKKENK